MKTQKEVVEFERKYLHALEKLNEENKIVEYFTLYAEYLRLNSPNGLMGYRKTLHDMSLKVVDVLTRIN